MPSDIPIHPNQLQDFVDAVQALNYSTVREAVDSLLQGSEPPLDPQPPPPATPVGVDLFARNFSHPTLRTLLRRFLFDGVAGYGGDPEETLSHMGMFSRAWRMWPQNYRSDWPHRTLSYCGFPIADRFEYRPYGSRGNRHRLRVWYPPHHVMGDPELLIRGTQGANAFVSVFDSPNGPATQDWVRGSWYVSDIPVCGRDVTDPGEWVWTRLGDEPYNLPRPEGWPFSNATPANVAPGTRFTTVKPPFPSHRKVRALALP